MYVMSICWPADYNDVSTTVVVPGNQGAGVARHKKLEGKHAMRNQQPEGKMNEAKHTPIPNYPGYAITEDGRVFSIAHNWRGYGVRCLVAFPNEDVYPSVRLSVSGRRIHVPIYKLMALTFLPLRPSPAHEIRHLDGDKFNANVGNLMWGTCKDNADDRETHGRTSRGARHSIAIRQGMEKRGFNVKW